MVIVMVVSVVGVGAPHVVFWDCRCRRCCIQALPGISQGGGLRVPRTPQIMSCNWDQTVAPYFTHLTHTDYTAFSAVNFATQKKERTNDYACWRELKKPEGVLCRRHP